MKILQVGDICGIPHLLACEQRRRGHEADFIQFPQKYDIFSRIDKFITLFLLIPNYDRIHFHYSTGLPFGLDLLLWRLLKKDIVIQFHGSDIRGKGVPFLIEKLARKIYVSTPDLLQWAPNAQWMPQPFDFSSLSE